MRGLRKSVSIFKKAEVASFADDGAGGQIVFCDGDAFYDSVADAFDDPSPVAEKMLELETLVGTRG